MSFIITADHGDWYLTGNDIRRHLPLQSVMYKTGWPDQGTAAQPMQISDAPVWHYDILLHTEGTWALTSRRFLIHTTPLDESYE